MELRMKKRPKEDDKRQETTDAQKKEFSAKTEVITLTSPALLDIFHGISSLHSANKQIDWRINYNFFCAPGEFNITFSNVPPVPAQAISVGKKNSYLHHV
jgi:hypothetical protein